MLEQIGSGHVFVKGAGFVFLNPDPDQIAADVVALGERMQGLAGQEFLSDLVLELDAMRAVLGHGLPSFQSPVRWSILVSPTVLPQGPTPIAASVLTLIVVDQSPPTVAFPVPSIRIGSPEVLLVEDGLQRHHAADLKIAPKESAAFENVQAADMVLREFRSYSVTRCRPAFWF